MERLTTNKPVDEMSMLELVYNSCCVSEDGSAMYKDFETVRDARDFVRNLYKVHLNEEMPTDDDIFDESMIDELQYEPEVHLNGLIALFYRNLWAMADLRETLKAYEDKQEQGLLIELDSKDELIEVLAKLVFNSEFGRCYMCTNGMKNITLDGENNGCDGNCKQEEFTVDDLLKKIVAELKRNKARSEAEEALAKMGGK